MSNFLNASVLAPELSGITNWLNTLTPLILQKLQGQVVLVHFWTHGCINCIHTIPYVNEWYNKYRDKGFIILGIHTPEFDYEKETENVKAALKQYDIQYPIAQDNDYKTWEAFNNRYWPADYLIDKQGTIRRTHVGEGEYEEMDRAIQLLLNEFN